MKKKAAKLSLADRPDLPLLSGAKEGRGSAREPRLSLLRSAVAEARKAILLLGPRGPRPSPESPPPPSRGLARPSKGRGGEPFGRRAPFNSRCEPFRGFSAPNAGLAGSYIISLRSHINCEHPQRGSCALYIGRQEIYIRRYHPQRGRKRPYIEGEENYMGTHASPVGIVASPQGARAFLYGALAKLYGAAGFPKPALDSVGCRPGTFSFGTVRFSAGPPTQGDERMKKTVLVLLALLALVPFARAMAQTPSAPAPDAATARFLATLAAPQAPAPSGLTPAPLFTQTGCGSGPACPTGQLCCFVCGNPPADGDLSGCYSCLQVTRCPRVV